MSDKLIELMKKTSSIKITCEFRRCEEDSSGLELPSGRDNYGLWNWEVDGKENEWPGFWNPEDCLKDMYEKLNQTEDEGVKN
jgi:hypothetical protein